MMRTVLTFSLNVILKQFLLDTVDIYSPPLSPILLTVDSLLPFSSLWNFLGSIITARKDKLFGMFCLHILIDYLVGILTILCVEQ